MDPQAFLMNRVNQIKDLFTGDASVQSTLTTVAPGGALGKAAINQSLGMFRSAGKEGSSKLSLLGGDAPVYEAGYDELLDMPAKKILPSMPAVQGAVGSVISRLH